MSTLNVDFNKLFPNQNLEHRETACVGETVADIVGNIIRTQCDAGFSYAAALRLIGSIPTTNGTDPLWGMRAAVAYGVLPVAEQDFDAVSTSELYEANFDNYAPEDRAHALTFAQRGVQTLGADFILVAGYIARYQSGVSLATHWYDSFEQPLPGGKLPLPQGNFTNHNVAVYGLVDGCLIIKSWQGSTYGDGGYVYMSPEVFKGCVQGAWGFDPDAIRWISLVGYLIQRFPYLLPYLSALLQPK